jgi:hypothetical protein
MTGYFCLLPEDPLDIIDVFPAVGLEGDKDGEMFIF